MKLGDFMKEAKKKKYKLNRYDRKMYHKKYKHINKINNFVPWYKYSYDFDLKEHIYWKQYYVGIKDSKNYSNRIIRRTRVGEEDFSLKGYSCHKKYGYWYDVF